MQPLGSTIVVTVGWFSCDIVPHEVHYATLMAVPMPYEFQENRVFPTGSRFAVLPAWCNVRQLSDLATMLIASNAARARPGWALPSRRSH